MIPRANLGLLGSAAILIGTKTILGPRRRRDITAETLEAYGKSGANGRTATGALVTITKWGRQHWNLRALVCHPVTLRDHHDRRGIRRDDCALVLR